MSAEEFIEWERSQLDKHEFHDGAVYAMDGASPRQNKIASTLNSVFGRILRGGACDALESNQMVKSRSSYVYPDLSVVCEDPEFERSDQGLILLNPTMIVEVLSRSTEAYDRGDKFRRYRALPSLRDYLLVSQREARIEHLQLIEPGWTLVADVTQDGSIKLSNGASFAVEEVYEGAWRFPGDD